MKILLLAILFALSAQSLPVCDDCDQTVRHGRYTLCYSEKHEQPHWVAYDLSIDHLMCRARRKDSFRTDPHIKTGSANLYDYRRSGYDRGHLAPAADFKCDMRSTFFMSNMSPQRPKFNRGVWKRLETWVRNQARFGIDLRVVTGPVLVDGLPTIGYNLVSVPSLYYKVILSDDRAIGFIMPNYKSKCRVESFAVSIDSVESLTGIDFFSDLPDSVEDELEARRVF